MKSFKECEKTAMFELGDEERERIRGRFEEVVAGFSVIDSFDTDGAEPLVSVLDLNNVMRDDVAVKVVSRDELLENAPEQNDGYFQVPAAIN